MPSVTPDVLEREVTPSVTGHALEAQTRGEVDVQIATAKRYPRSIKTFIEHATEMATLDEDTAASCFYALPRDGRTVEGPSARLAEICASAWGHMRIQARTIGEDLRFVTARGEAWDLQTNVAIGYEVKRRITDRQKQTFSDDMVVVTSNAAASIALRNAVFKVIPSAFWRPIYLKCRQVAVGPAQTLADRRVKMLEHFQKMGVEAARVFALLEVKGIQDVTLEHLATLRGLATAIKDGDTSIDEAFKGPGARRDDAATGETTATPPDGYDGWLIDLDIVAGEDGARFEAVYAASKPEYRQHLKATNPGLWDRLKAKAGASAAKASTATPSASSTPTPAVTPAASDDPFDLVPRG